MLAAFSCSARLCLLIWLPIKKYLLVSYLQSLSRALYSERHLTIRMEQVVWREIIHSWECESMMCHVDFYQCALEFLIFLDFLSLHERMTDYQKAIRTYEHVFFVSLNFFFAGIAFSKGTIKKFIFVK